MVCQGTHILERYRWKILKLCQINGLILGLTPVVLPHLANAAGFVFVGRQEQGPGLINLRQQREFLFCWPKNRVRGWSHAAPWAARNQPLTRCRVQPLYSVGTTPAILKRFSTRWPEGYTEVSVSSSLPLCSVGEAAMLTTDTCRQTSLFLPAARGATMVNGRQMLYIYFICR